MLLPGNSRLLKSGLSSRTSATAVLEANAVKADMGVFKVGKLLAAAAGISAACDAFKRSTSSVLAGDASITRDLGIKKL